MSPLTFPPFKGSTVRVSVLDGGRTEVAAAYVFTKPAAGHDRAIMPCFSFLIENDKQNKKVLYDLGIMKAWKQKQPPIILQQVEMANSVLEVKADIAEQLTANSIPLSSINSIIWSHHHVDHTGDPSTFPSSVTLTVGPGFKSNSMTYPGYPKNPNSIVADDAFHGRELIELDFSSSTIEIGGLKAIDYFGDGSFYLIYSPGHTMDHICGLARTSESKFLLLGGDFAHHMAEYRPSEHVQLPDTIKPSPFTSLQELHSSCPGEIFASVHPAGSSYKTKPFYDTNPMMAANLEEDHATLHKLQAFDASPDVFVIIAHDNSLLDVFTMFPKGELTGWETKAWKDVGRWRFLKDFEKAVKA